MVFFMTFEKTVSSNECATFTKIMPPIGSYFWVKFLPNYYLKPSASSHFSCSCLPPNWLLGGDWTHPSLILFVLSTLSMSIRILYLTWRGSSTLPGVIPVNTTPAQNFRSSSNSMDLLMSRTSVATGSSLFKLTHWQKNSLHENSGGQENAQCPRQALS